MAEETSIENLPNPGVLLDLRSPEEKAKDYRFAEIVSAIEPVNWIEKPQNTWRKFPIFNQNGSGSCVAQTLRKLYGVYIWLNTGVYVDISASHIYQRRSNKPGTGMSGTNAFDIAQKGTTLEQFAPSEKMNDAQMDNIKVLPFMEKIGETFKLGTYITVSPTDIDTVASIIQKTGKAVMVWFYFTYPEWTNTPTVLDPNLNLSAPSTLRHSVAAVDFTLVNGKKALIIDESWGLGTALDGQRIITEDFFKARNWFAAHFQNFAFEQVSEKPKYTFTTPLEFGSTSADVKALQNILKYENLYPTNVESTGYYGSITAAGVLKWQTQHNVAPASELVPLAGRRVGTKTVTALNQIYG